jgi:hypothetical protein
VSKIVLLAVAATWAAVLVPPLLRGRADNRPGSSVSDFRRQLSSLERAVPTRTMVQMRSMARPLTQTGRHRVVAPHPAQIGQLRRPVGQRVHGLAAQPQPRQRDGRPAGPARTHREVHLHRVSQRELIRRRRTNVLFVLFVTNVLTLFLAATTKAHYLVYVFAVAFVALCGYCYKLAQLRNEDSFRPYDAWSHAA